MKHFKQILCSILALTALTLGSAPLAHAYDPVQSSCSKIGDAGSFCKNQSDTELTGKNGIIMTFTKITAVVGGVSAIIVIVIAGARMIMSGGDSSSVAKARSTVIYALVGLVIMGIAPSIVGWVLSHVIK